MTYQTYKNSLILIMMLYFLLLLLDVFKYIMPSAESSFLFAIVVFFAPRVLALFLLFFSIYATVSGVIGTRKLEAPAIFIAIGAFFVISSFGPPILFGYLAHHKLKDKHEYIQPKKIEKQTPQEMVMKNNLMASWRQLEIAATNARNTACILVCMLVITTLGFIFLLWYRFKQGTLRSGFK